MTTTIDLTPQQLRRAAALKDKLVSLQNELNRVLGVSAPAQKGAPVRKRRKMSAAGRASIAAAQKARWAKQRGAKAGKATANPKRKMSVAARKRMARLARERWAKAKAAGKKTL